MSALDLSIRVSLTATALSILLGTGIAWVLAHRRFPGRSLLEGVSILPLVLPPTVLGYYMLVSMGPQSGFGRFYRSLTGTDLAFEFWGIVTAACVASIPLYIRQAQTAFSGVDKDIEDSARCNGASGLQVFRYITLPLARRGVVAGIVLSFARALGDFGATLMIGGDIPDRTRTLPLAVYNTWQSGDNQQAQGLCLLLSAIAVAVGVTAARLSHKD